MLTSHSRTRPIWAVFFVLAVATAATAAQPEEKPITPTWTGWPPAEWPQAASDPKVQKELIEGHWSAEEKRNLQTTVQMFSGDQRGSQFRDAHEVRTRLGFDGLDELYGSHGYNAPVSTADRVNKIEDVIAKDDRVWVVFAILTHHTGLMYGFPGTGKPMQLREFAYLRFKNGKVIESTFRAEELQIYTQLGGKTEFPKN